MYFDQAVPVVLRQFEAKLVGDVPWKIEVVNLDEGLREISVEAVLVFGGSSPPYDIFVTNLNFVMNPLRAIKFTAAGAWGLARVVASRSLVVA